MADRTITVTIPELLYRQLEATARSTAQSVDRVVAQTLEQSIPPQLAALVPPVLRDELTAMTALSDAALWAIALSVAGPDLGTQLDELTAQKQAGTLSPDKQHRLTTLSAESEALMVRKAHAFALLKSRGHVLPPLHALPVPSA